MRFEDHGDRFALARYPFRGSGGRGLVPAASVREVLTQRFPPEVWLDDGEILFVSREDLEPLVAFADRNRLPLTDREDVWALLLEDCLDTEHSDAGKERTRERLRKLGIGDEEADQWRRRTHPRVLRWNAFAWEWVHLGLFDLLWASYGPFARCGIGSFATLFRESMKLAHRAPRHEWDEAGFRRELEACFEPELYARWKTLWAAIGLPPSRDVYREILATYAAPGRHYHDREHLKSVVGRLADRAASVEAQLAGWFHDFVDTTAKEAERKSAVVARSRLLACGLAPDRAAKVAALVETTANHWKLVGDDRDARALAEADLWILGAPPERYRLYAVQVRLEYRRVPWILFRHGRLKFLKKLWQRDTIGFDTTAEWEKRARANLEWEIAQWRRFRTPRPW